jgi:hypothetical protein
MGLGREGNSAYGKAVIHSRLFYMALSRPIALFFAISAGLLLAIFPFLLITMGLEGDFLAFYTGGQVVWKGELAHLYDSDLFLQWQQQWVASVDRAYRYVYLPVFVSYFLPFSGLPLPIARISAALFALVLLAFSLRISRRWQSLSWGSMVLAVVAFAGSYATFVVVQNSPLSLALLSAITVWMLYRPRPIHAGIAAGLLLYKPQLLMGVGVVWLVRRAWQPLMILFGIGAIWIILSWLFAPEALQGYLVLGQQVTNSLPEIANANASLYAALVQGFPQSVATVGAGSIAVIAIGLLAWAWRQSQPTPFHMAMVWLCPLVASPYIANYDLLLLLLPISLLISFLRQYRLLQVAVTIVWVAPAIGLIAPNLRFVPWAILGLYGVCAWYALNHKQEGVATRLYL